MSAALLSSAVSANTFNLGLNNDTVEAGLKIPFSASGQISANYLYADDEGKILDIGFQTIHNSSNNRIELGGKLLKLWSKKRNNGQAFALGGAYRMPVAPSITAAIEAYYAPSVLSWSGVDRFYNIDAKLMYEVMPTADLYLGYRDVHFKFDSESDQTLDQSFYLGAELKF
ncbi:MAG: YfaZ family outer membrane protein [Halopseudomonas sp.]